MKKIILILIFIISSVLFADNNTMSKNIYSALMKSQKLLEKDNYSKAKTLLSPLLKKDLNGYEKSYILQTLANISIHYDDYKKTANYYEQIIKLNSLEQKSIEQIKLSLSKIYLSLNQYDKSIKILKNLLDSKTIAKSTIYENLLYGTYYKGNYKKSIFYYKKLITFSKKREEPWYQILYSSYIQVKQYKNAIDVLNIMVKKWHNNENYWLQLIALYQEIKNYKKALSTFELAYKKGGVDPKENTLYFVNILLENGLYYKAAKQIENGIKKGFLKDNKRNFELLISSLDYAKQKDDVIKLLSTSKFAKNIKYQLLLGNIYYNQEEYKKSIKILENIAIKKGSKQAGQRDILLALSYYEINNKKQTTKYLRKAINNPHERKRALSIKKSLNLI